MIKLQASPRGLLRGEFSDRLDQECSIQEASEMDEDCLWLGIDKDFKGEEPASRMQLTKRMAQDLIPLLRSFVSTGNLEETSIEAYRVGTWVKGAVKATEGIEGRVVSTDAGGAVIQDNVTPGPDGQHICAWEALDVFWEVIDKPDHLLSRFERIRTGEI